MAVTFAAQIHPNLQPKFELVPRQFSPGPAQQKRKGSTAARDLNFLSDTPPFVCSHAIRTISLVLADAAI